MKIRSKLNYTKILPFVLILLFNFYEQLGATKLHDRIKVGMFGTLKSDIDTSLLNSIWSFFVVDHMTEQLLYAHKDDYYSGIARKWEVSKDKKRYVFYIDESAKFSDGSPITSKEVAFSFKRLILRTGLHWKISNYILGADKLKTMEDDIAGIEVINKSTIAFNLKKPYGAILYMLSMAESGVLKPSQVDKKDLSVKSWDIVSGAYSGQYIDGRWILTLNPFRLKYKKRFPMAKVAEFVQVKDKKLVEQMFIKGKLDIFIPGSDYSEDIRLLLSSENIQNTLGAPASTEYYYLNISKPPFNDVNLRRSILKQWYSAQLIFPKDNNGLTAKADQLYLPTCPGYLSKKEIDDVLKTVKNKSYKKSIKVKLMQPLGKVLPFHIKTLKSILNNHKIKLEIVEKERQEGYKAILSNDYHILTTYTSMSPSEVDTVLSFMFSKKLPLHDIHGDILPLINKASHTVDPIKNSNINKEIAKKLILNAEIIPSLYIKMPFFYQKGLDLSAIDKYNNDLHLWEIKFQ